MIKILTNNLKHCKQGQSLLMILWIHHSMHTNFRRFPGMGEVTILPNSTNICPHINMY